MIRTQEGNNDSSHAVGGGAATHAGIDYQNRIAAWAAVSILAEQNASLPFGLPAAITLEYFRCETEQPVDDILIGTSSNGLLFLQVKHTISLEKGSASGLASTIKQFVRQFLAYSNESSGRLLERPLNDNIDRLILATGIGSSKSISDSLKMVLDRVRVLMPGQALEDAAKNQDEKEALTVVINHISNAWLNESGVQATQSEIQSILRLIWIITFDLDQEGSTEIEAKNLLRSTILQNPAEADAAWSILVQASANYARNRSGGDRSLLQKQLLNKGIDIKCISSYLGDIQCLRKFSGATFNQLTDFSKISIGKTEVKIIRKSTMSLRSVVENGSIVIVGEPGAGKSGALHDLVSDLYSDQFDVVFIAVDRIEATSQSSLRNEIGISHEFIDVLKNWVGVKPAFLVIDALDAARTDLAIQTFRNIISTIIKLDSRWNVVVSIRKFDLRYNKQLQDLFSGTPPTEFRDKEFDMIYHINIPKLDDEELKQIESQSKDLANLALNSSSQLNELLRSPFNLRLMGDLLGLKVPVKELSPINKQTELLDRYWTERIIREDAYGDAREIVLRKICKGLVKLRSLKISRMEIVEQSNSDIIKDLLSSQVIVEWQASSESIPERYIIAFSHNVIYDYAVSRLMLRLPLNDFINILTEDPELLLAIRPSIVYHFKYIWTLDTPHQSFWTCVNSVICCKDIPEIGKLIGPSVASELNTKIEDFEQLFRMLEDSDETTKQNAEKACSHVIGALLSLPPNSKFFVGDESGPWAQFLLRLSESIRRSTAYIIRQLLITLCEYHDKFTEEQAACIGISARRLLTFALESADRDQWLINHAIQAVCRTFYSDVKESNRIIRRLLEPEHMKLYAAEEMHWLAREIKNLISIDPDLVEDVYKVAFTFNENSEEKTQIGGSRIIPMSSTRKQDYSMVRYELVNTFSDFIRVAPVNAIRALIVAINGYVIEEHSTTEEMIAESFEFNGLPTKIKTDYSTIWDDGGAYHHDNALKMLDSFEQFLLDTTLKSAASDIRKEIISIIAKENYSAVIWKRLLKCGIKEPNTIGQEIKSLIWAKPIFNCIDTGVLAGDLIKAIFENLTRQEKQLVEKAILFITEDSASDSQTQFKEKTRNRLLGCIPDSLIVSEQVRQIIDELKACNAVPPNEPYFRFSSGWTGEPYDEEKYLADEGVPVLEEANKIIRDIEKPIDDFSKKYLNSAPPREAIQSIFPSIRQLYEALCNADDSGVHPQQKDYAWGTLTEALERIAAFNEISSCTKIEHFVKSVLLEAAKHQEPKPHPEYDSQFDNCPSWGKPAPRIDAAKGLTLLAYSSSSIDTELLETIASLAKDEVPAVRFQVVANLVALYKTAPDVMWEIINYICDNENSKGVLHGLLTGTFFRIAGANANTISQLTKMVFERVDQGPGADTVKQACVNIFSGLYLWQNIDSCRDIINEMADNPKNYLDEIRHLILDTRELLTHGPVNPSDEVQDSIRRRAFTICERVLDSVSNEINDIYDNKIKTGVKLSSDESDLFKGLAEIMDTIATEIYFASGAYDETRSQQEDRRILTLDVKKRFLQDADYLLNHLSDFGMLPSITHYLLETLEAYIPIDPVNIFNKIGKIVIVAQSGGYQYESLAADLIVKIIERYLAEYSFIFREYEQCQRTLLEILDIFVNAGWPSARRLTYRLEEIYR